MTAEEFRILQDRWNEILGVDLKEGSHTESEDEFCVMEAVAYVAGEPWSDAPACACPVISAFMRSWNDGLPSDEDRNRLLRSFIPRLVGSRSTKAVEERRAFLAMDWTIRVFTPRWLDLVPSLAPHAQALRDLEEIADIAGLVAAGEKLSAAREASAAAWAAAWDAARAAAWAAARAAAWDAARAAAWAAARAAAWDAAWAAAWDAAGAAAWAAAWDAAGAAAWAAAWDALKPTTEWLQLSAVNLVERMLAVGADRAAA